MEKEDILEKLAEADMVLVGLGEEFDGQRILRSCEGYQAGCETLKEAGMGWMIPGWEEFHRRRCGDGTIPAALERLAALLKDKNHFVVSVSTNGETAHVGRVVMPCGAAFRKQCANGCAGVLEELTDEDRAGLEHFFEGSCKGKAGLGVCPECGAPMILNNIYAENYNEEGYLEQWRLYMKWLQGTLNRRLLVLELGVGMRFPSVIRWPFEKAAFFNQKAYFCRVNENLYQLTKELAQKGCGISKNAIDWLGQLW